MFSEHKEENFGLGMMVHTCNHSYLDGEDGRTVV
jgi:hypothetical protein